MQNRLCDFFENFKMDAMQMTIGGVIQTGYFNGVDFVPLMPTDTECEFAYMRPLGDATGTPIRISGCNDDYIYSQRYLFVSYSKVPRKLDKVLRKLKEAFGSENFKIERIISNKEDLLKKEGSIIKNVLSLQSIGYVGVELTHNYQIEENCIEDEC
jgi:hypothetical protein